MTAAAQSGDRLFGALRVQLGSDGVDVLDRCVPIEAPIAIEYNGIAYAVMMATPTELEAFVTGFSLSEGLVEKAAEIISIAVHPVEGRGWVVRVSLPQERAAAVIERARLRLSEGSCGLCGLESIEQVLRPLPPVAAPAPVERAAIAQALAQLTVHQPLGRATGAAHVAAYCSPDGAVRLACEDVGRHNALDKLVGTAALQGLSLSTGFILLSARCSYELVEKTARAGCPMLVTISAPTSLAVERARAAGLTLVALARADNILVFNDPHGCVAHVDAPALV